MTSRYERYASRDALLARLRELAPATVIFDIEPLIAFWRTGRDALDLGIAAVVDQMSAIPAVRAVCFSTNSARTPARLPERAGLEVSYLASARKPLRLGPYRRLPRPGVVVGDQVATDGTLARRLGYTFLHYSPELPGMPAGPRLMRQSGRLVRPFLFRGPPSGPVPGQPGQPPGGREPR